VAAGDRQEIDERVKVPQPVLDRGRSEHEDIPKPPFLERLLEAQGDLRRRINTVKS
jgi:hypothetical protein